MINFSVWNAKHFLDWANRAFKPQTHVYTHLDDGKIVEEPRGIMMFPEFNIQADTKDMVFQRYKEQKLMVFSYIIGVENERSGNTYIKILHHVYMQGMAKTRYAW